MPRWLRIALISLTVIVALALVTAGSIAAYFLLITGRAPAKRPDLVRLPEDAPTPPRGYPTQNAALVSVLMGFQEVLDPQGEIPVPGGVTEKLGVEYGRVGDRPLLLDLYAPAAATDPVPGLIFIHGGGWEMGNRSDYKYYTVRFANHGYVAATISYRFSQEALFPAAVEDAKCAVRWMRSNAADLGVDPDRIAVIGGSAGGHLALMVGYAPDVPELEGTGGHEGVSSAVRVVVDLYGPPDLTVPGDRDFYVVPKFLGGTYEEMPERYTLASPLHYLDPSDPPTLIMHGTIDQILSVTHSDALAEKLQALGMPYWYDRLDGWPHTMDLAKSVNERVLFLMDAFFEEYLNDSGT
jgi:acetyl esterase/lipase